jgi:hypothetical protein
MDPLQYANVHVLEMGVLQSAAVVAPVKAGIGASRVLGGRALPAGVVVTLCRPIVSENRKDRGQS